MEALYCRLGAVWHTGGSLMCERYVSVLQIHHDQCSSVSPKLTSGTPCEPKVSGSVRVPRLTCDAFLLRRTLAPRGSFTVIPDPPRAVDTGSQLTAREGNTLRLSCVADGYPPVEVSWAKGGRTLKEWSPPPDHWLELTNLTVEDKGDYTCRARNALATVQSTFQLDIACE